MFFDIVYDFVGGSFGIGLFFVVGFEYIVFVGVYSFVVG